LFHYEEIHKKYLEGRKYPLLYKSYNLCLIYFNVHTVYKKAKNARKSKVGKKEKVIARNTRSET